MIVFESRMARRFVGRLERGEEVIATLAQLCQSERIRSAWISGSGWLEWAEIAEWDPEREAWRAPRRIEGLLTAGAMTGSVAIRNGPPFVQIGAVMSGTEGTFSGMIAAARVYALDVALEVYDDVRLERDEDTATGLSLFKGSGVRGVLARESRRQVEPAATSPARPRELGARPPREAPSIETEDEVPSAPPPPQAPVSWADAARASAEASSRPTAPARSDARRPAAPHLPFVLPSDPKASAHEDEDLLPGRGDWIDHRQFGICRVDGEDEDGGLRIRLPSGVRKVIKLDVFEVLPPRHEGDRKVFPLRPRKR